MPKDDQINLLTPFRGRVKGLSEYESILKKINLYFFLGYLVLLFVVFGISFVFNLRLKSVQSQIDQKKSKIELLGSKEALHNLIKSRLKTISEVLKQEENALGNKEAIQRVLNLTTSGVNVNSASVSSFGNFVKISGTADSLYHLHLYFENIIDKGIKEGGFESAYSSGFSQQEESSYSFSLVLVANLTTK